MKMRTLLPAALAVVLTAPFAHASGSATATVNVSNLQFRVIDLTPDDGIAAGFRLTGAYGNMAARFFNADTDEWKYVPYSFASAEHDLITHELDGKHISSSATNSALASTATVSTLSAPRGYVGLYTANVWEFSLAPNSMLVLTGDVALGASTSQFPSGTSIAHARMNAYGWLDGQRPSFEDHADSYWGHDQLVNNGFGLAFANVTDAAAAGRAVLEGNADVQFARDGNIPAIPEPATYMMLVSGLVGVAVARRRTRMAV